jgi:multidrug efflux system membrane fusion protein
VSCMSRLPLLLAALACAAPMLASAALAQEAVPVTAATVERRDVPVIAEGIGTVQALQTVLVRARVDGTLDRVLFTEGQEVKQGDALAEIDPRPYQEILNQAVAKRAADQANLNTAQGDLQRYSSLAQKEFASRQQLDQQRGSVGQLEAAVRGDDAAIAAANLNLSFTRIAAPFSGRVGLRMVDPGNLIQSAASGQGIVTLAQTKPIAVLYTLPQDKLPAIRAAQGRGEIPVAAYSGDGKTRLDEGTLLAIDAQIDPATGTIRLKATFPNAQEHLWPGQFVRIRTRLDTLHGAVTVPSAAVQHGPNGLYAYLIGPDGKAKLQPIEVAQDQEGVAVVSKGLDRGEQVVVAGQSRLADGMAVTVATPKRQEG